jgi:hypothetical protein
MTILYINTYIYLNHQHLYLSFKILISNTHKLEHYIIKQVYITSNILVLFLPCIFLWLFFFLYYNNVLFNNREWERSEDKSSLHLSKKAVPYMFFFFGGGALPLCTWLYKWSKKSIWLTKYLLFLILYNISMILDIRLKQRFFILYIYTDKTKCTKHNIKNVSFKYFNSHKSLFIQFKFIVYIKIMLIFV